VVFAAIGFTQQFGAPDLLAVFKNGNYAMMAGSVGGLIRISGCFSETSGWSAYSLGLLAFSQSLWIDGYRPKFSGFVAVATLGFLLISTSGTAYGGLALLSACVYGAFLYRKIRRQSYARDHIYIWALWLGLLALILILLFVPQVVQIVVDFFDTTVGNKLESSSGVERSSWTAQAWSNVISTYGLGTGLGTNISSNFVALLISNTGWFGTLLYVLFMYQSLFGTPSSKRGDAAPDVDWRVIRAGRWGMVGVLSAAVFSARVFDLGVPFFMYAAAAGYYQLVVSKQGVQTLSAFKTRTAA